jgi:hypothetical protein
MQRTGNDPRAKDIGICIGAVTQYYDQTYNRGQFTSIEVNSQAVGLVPALSCSRRIILRSTSVRGWLAIHLINIETNADSRI